jgi:hypothetical protein
MCREVVQILLLELDTFPSLAASPPPPSTRTRALDLVPASEAMRLVHRDLVRNGPGSVKVPLAFRLFLYLSLSALSIRAVQLLVGFALYWG